MKTIVITGSTRGIGLGLAKEFLKRDCAVVVSGRTLAAVNQVVTDLSALPVPSFTQAPIKAQVAARTSQLYLAESAPRPDHVLGRPCDVADYAQVQALWDAAVAKFGRVDIWINNAGVSHPRVSFWDQKPERFAPVTDTNLRGVMNGTHVALQGMLAQKSGQIYNLEGFGSGGQMAEGMLLYGSTKRAVTYFTDSLAKDLKDKPVQVCHLSPGIVLTDLLVDDYAGQPERFERAKKFFNILGDNVETVTPYLADRVLANAQRGVRANGTRVAWLTFPKIMFRFLTAGFIKRDLFAEPTTH